MKYIFHRGYHNSKEEENKITAFINAFNNPNAYGIETDVRETLDHVFVLYHDPLFEGKLINKCLYKDLKKQNIPSLEDLLKIKTDKIILLEIKDFNLNLNKFISILNKYKRNIYIMSFNNKVIQKILNKTTKYKLGTLNYVFNTIDNYPFNFICILNSLLTPYVIDSYKRINVEVFSYGITKSSLINNKNILYIIDNKYL